MGLAISPGVNGGLQVDCPRLGNTLLDLDLWGPSSHLSPISGISTQILTTYADKVQLVNI